MAKQFWVDFDEELHCDECQEVAHFHFDESCPACNAHRAGTDQYQSVADCIREGGVFRCQECDAKFHILQYEYAAETEKDALIEVLDG